MHIQQTDTVSAREMLALEKDTYLEMVENLENLEMVY